MNCKSNNDLKALARIVLEVHFGNEPRGSHVTFTSFRNAFPHNRFSILSIPSMRTDNRGLRGSLYSVLSSSLEDANNTPIDEFFTFKASHAPNMPPTLPEVIRIKNFVDGPWIETVRDAHAAMMRNSVRPGDHRKH